METVPGVDLSRRYEELILRAASDERIILSHAGHKAALVSLEDLAILENLDREHDRQDVEVVKHRLADPMDVAIPFVREHLINEAASG